MCSMANVSFSLFCEYLRELDQIVGQAPQTPSEDFAYYEEIISSDCTEWIDIWAYGERFPVGFLIVSREPNCHPDADFFIQESYIKPKFRKQGLMTATVSKFIKEHEGVYCLFILNNNVNAYQFWHNIFPKLNYHPYELYVCTGIDICTQYGFAPKKENF